MTTLEHARVENPRWLATVVTALPVVLAALLVPRPDLGDVRRPPAAARSKPAPAAPAEPRPNTTVARAP